MLKRKSIPSPNCSSRGGATVRAIVLHSAEGARTIESLGSFFKNSANQVSSHTGADDQAGVIGEYVKPSLKAWTAANANPVAVQIELCAFTSWSRAEWLKHPNMLDNCAHWIAEEAQRFGIPIVKLTPQQAQANGRGVCQHRDLGAWGGGHHDCGNGFPYDDVLNKARLIAAGKPAGGGTDEMGYPQWFKDWAEWYLTTTRDKKTRPKAAPAKIPQWAWDALADTERIAKRLGMTPAERAWIDWRAKGSDPKKRPKGVPEKIPDGWWDDNAYVIAKAK